MTDQPPARRLSDKIKAAWLHALEMGRDEVADRLSLIYEATVMMDSEKFPRRRSTTDDAAAVKLTASNESKTPSDDASASSDGDKISRINPKDDH
jgi:hypothetical protein